MRWLIIISIVLASCGSQDGAPIAPSRFSQLDTPSGSTHVDSTKGITFDLWQVTPELINTFAQRTGFFTLHGERVAGAQPSMTADGHLVLKPTAPLAAGSWFELKTEAATEYRVVFSSFDDRMLFFTGSAPKVRLVSHATVLKGTQHLLTIELTEAAPVTSLAIFDGATQLNGCVIYGDVNTCSMPPVAMTTFNYAFAERTATYPNLTRLELNGTSYELGPWTNCYGSDDTICWVRPIF